jgi:hypothetical protein
MFGTVVGVDWSGAASAAAQRRGIWAATVRDGGVADLRNGTREEVVGYVGGLPGSVLVGFDFAFAFPSWFEPRGADAAWRRAELEGEHWLAACPWPFWGRTGRRRPSDVPSELRAQERALGAKSVFQIGGAGTVGTGTIRGMPHLARLRADGWSIWPFDPVGPRTAVEVYPRVAARLLGRTPPSTGRDVFDAEVAALAMWHRRDQLARVERTASMRREGCIWPTASAPTVGAVSPSVAPGGARGDTAG